jgi:D-arabinose 1-dehydrogenase-like Zn-dependent alcohol dehydrogenase
MARTQMKALIFRQPNSRLELTELEVPQPGKRQVRIKVEACGVCHSDLGVQANTFGNVEYPRVPGHEVVGTIETVGPDVEGWSVGQRVGVGWDGGHCFRCPPCREGIFACCQNQKVPGFSYDGGYAEYMVAPYEALAALPAELGFAEAAPLLCAGVTTFNALRNSGARPGDVVAIQGIGGLGHLGVQFASRSGFHTVAISRGSDGEKRARELGAKTYINSDTQDPAKELTRLGGAKTILATAPNAKAMSALVDGLGVTGKMIVIGIDAEKIQLSPLQLIPRLRGVQGWAAGSSRDSEDTLRFSVLTGVRPIIEQFPLEKGVDAFQRMATGKARYRAVIVMGGASR